MSDMLDDIFGDNFDVEGAAASSSGGEFSLVPEGWHNVEIVRAERKPTNAGDGTGINIGFKTRNNRWLWRYFYVHTTDPSKSSGAENGRADFAKMVHEGMGLRKMPKSLALLEGQELAVKVAHKMDDYRQEKAEKIVAFGKFDPSLETLSGSKSIAQNVAANSAGFDDDVPF